MKLVYIVLAKPEQRSCDDVFCVIKRESFMEKIKAILFDKDGTLIDYDKSWMPLNHKAALHLAAGDKLLADKMLIHSGWSQEKDTAKPDSILAAGTEIEILQCWLELQPNNIKSFQQLSEEIHNLFLTEIKNYAAPLVNLHGLFKYLQGLGLKLGVASSDSKEGIEASLANFNILPMCDFICGYDSGYGIKPTAGMVNGFCQVIDIKPAEIAVIGDNIHDLQMANAAGAMAIGVLTGTSGYDDLSPFADEIINDIDQLKIILSN